MLRVNPNSGVRLDEEFLETSGREFFAQYRSLNSKLFSDTEIVYENRLTPELFDLTLSGLSQERKQVQFENFILAVAARMITPNIKPHTGPDGGGDGQVDGETYPVDGSVSDKWWVSEGSSGDQRWAIAISVKHDWKPKVDDDVKKIVKTGRGYTRALFFTNQKIPSRIRFAEEEKLTKKYGITVSIFDGTWCSFVVFEQNCLDVALEKLAFSQEYLKKTVKVGPNDQKRQEELDRLEKGILSHVPQSRDSSYVDDLLTTCLLSRGLSRPRQETEGRFLRASRAASVHGSDMQGFRIVYNHAITAFFWFYDVDAVCRDYLILKDFTLENPHLKTIECLASVLCLFINAKLWGLSGIEGLEDELQVLEELKARPHLDDSSRFFIDIYLCEYRISQLLEQKCDPTAEIQQLLSLFSNCNRYPAISIEPHLQVVDSFSHRITDCPAFEDLVDLLADMTSERGAKLQGATVHFSRAWALYERGEFVQAIRHLGPCVNAFYVLGQEEQFIVACNLMAHSLFEQDLLFSAKAFLVHSVSFLVGLFAKSGKIHPLLLLHLHHLCEVEMSLGQLVMYLNWFRFTVLVTRDIQNLDQYEGVFKDMGKDDLVWARLIASSDISKQVFETLPDVLERNYLRFSADCLRYLLGHKDKLHSFTKLKDSDWQKAIPSLPLPRGFIWPLSISTAGPNTLSSIVKNCCFHITFENNTKNYLLAETFLAFIETLFATFVNMEIVMFTDEIRIQIVETDGKSQFIAGNSGFDYVFKVNHDAGDAFLWPCFLEFIGCLVANHLDSTRDLISFFQERQKQEQFMERVSTLIHLNKAVYSILGEDYGDTIDRWITPEDKAYPLNGEARIQLQFVPKSSAQQSDIICAVSSQMSWWDESGWFGVRLFVRENSFELPVLALLFQDLEGGKKIVAEWKTQMMSGDPNLEVFLVKGIDRDHPCWYAACFAPIIPWEKREQGHNIAVICRRQVIPSEDSVDFDRFEQAYSRFGKCRVMAISADDGKQLSESDHFKDSIECNHVLITDAWKVSVDDIARFAIVAESNPVIPKEYEKTAPVLELLEELRGMK